MSTVALAQGLPLPPRKVQVSNTVQTEARITGQTDPLSVVGTVALDPASLETLTDATALGNCTYTDGDPTATISTTAANIPASPMASRTAITIWNHSTAAANTIICSASGTATTTHGLRIEHGHQWWKWEGLGAGVTISCRCVTGTCTYGFLEERCYQ
jgi:hypothetical protein